VGQELGLDLQLSCEKSAHRAEIKIEGQDRLLRAIFESISLEVKSPPNPDRVHARSSYREGIISIEIYAHDMPSLRAALNSYLYLLYTLIKSLEASTTKFNTVGAKSG
jgi:tRNA threonylcarbamoyladenosine modification (KEOPS) complex  Pcc1 subunit